MQTAPETDVLSVILETVERQKTEPWERSQAWAEWEDSFLRASLGFLSEEAIGHALNRSAQAVRIRWRRELGLPSPTRTPGYLTAHQTALLLGVDVHAVCRWIEKLGILPAQLLPFRGRKVWRIRVSDIKRFVVKPEHWLLFRPERVGRLPRAWSKTDIRRLVELAVARFDDPWLTTQQAAEILGVTHLDVNRAMRRGAIPSVKCGNRHVLRSQVEQCGVYIAKRSFGPAIAFSDECDAFLMLARAVGHTPAAIAAMTKMPAKRIAEHQRHLTVAQTGVLAGKFGLPIWIKDGRWLADWKAHTREFPRLADAMAAFAEHKPLSSQHLERVRGVLWTWAVYWPVSPRLVRRLQTPIVATAAQRRLDGLRTELAAIGVDPWVATPSEMGGVSALTLGGVHDE